MSDSVTKELRAMFERRRDWLREITQIHVEIDAPKRSIRTGEPEWTLRLRKVCLHTRAITQRDISTDSLHVMATELRAAYWQMDAVWKSIPDEFKIDTLDDEWWSTEAEIELSKYDHPSAFSLMAPLANGGFGDTENPEGYLQLAKWIDQLVIGYALTLSALAQALDAEGNVTPRLTAMVRRIRTESSRHHMTEH